MTTQFLGSNLWTQLAALAKPSLTKRVVVAYYTDDTVIRCEAGDLLIVNASDEAIRGGQTSAKVLVAAKRRNVRVLSHPELHAKIVQKGARAIVSSANLSRASHQLREAGIFIDDEAVVRDVVRHIDQLEREATALSARELQRLSSLPVTPAKRDSSLCSILEALRDGSDILDRVAFGVVTGDHEKSEEVVRRAAKKEGMVYPHSAIWLESAGGAVLRRLEKACRRRLIINFGARCDADGLVQRLGQPYKQARPFLYTLELSDGTGISVYGPASRSVPFDLSRNRKELQQVLNRGLHRATTALRKRISNEEGVISTGDLKELYALGADPS